MIALRNALAQLIRAKGRARGDTREHAGRRDGGRLIWLCPALALLGPAVGEAAGEYLLGCLLFGSVLALPGAKRSGAIGWTLVWSVISGAFAVALLWGEVQDIPSLTVMTLATVAVQTIALLGVAAPATIAEWPARRLALLALAGPAALGMLTTGAAAGWQAWGASLAIALDLCGPPLAMMARRRADP